jgi:deoxyribose-phosphate aldolase
MSVTMTALATARVDDATLAGRLLPLLDLTLLDDQAGAADVAALCRRAADPRGAPASVRVWPQHVVQARGTLDQLGVPAVAVGTVVNFPGGDAEPERVEHELLQALGAGADEIDLVLPWAALLAGDADAARRLVARCRALCPAAVRLSVIIESGELARPALIAAASRLAIEAGADRLQTSTGRRAMNATPVAADIMLEVIQACGARSGFTAAGGVRQLSQAYTYLSLAEARLGHEWIRPARFRIRAGALHDAVLNALDAAAGD